MVARQLKRDQEKKGEVLIGEPLGVLAK